MAEIKLSVASVELRTCKLSKAILKQLPICNGWDDLRQHVSQFIRSPHDDRRLKDIEAKYSTATEDERKEAQELAAKKGFAEYIKMYTVGWIHGAVMGDEFTRFLMVQTEPGQYVLYRNAMPDTIAKFKQLFVL